MDVESQRSGPKHEIYKDPILPFGEIDQHVISSSQIVPSTLTDLFKKADELYELDNDYEGRRDLVDRHKGRRACSLFYEPSTRTRLSFETAALALGMEYVSTENAKEFSSAAKGETIEDTVRNLDEYGYDVIWIRHHETGSLARAATVAKTPLINAGDGAGEHPTQSLLDAYTINREFGRLDNLNIVYGGDIRYSRVIRSDAKLMSKYSGNKITFISFPEFSVADDIKQELRADGTPFNEITDPDDIADALRWADVVEWTRSQKERHANKGVISSAYSAARMLGRRTLENFASVRLEPQATTGMVLNESTIRKLPFEARIMHPLPRVDEISTSLDEDPRCIFFKQAGNGLYLRMALLDRVAVKS